MIKEGLSASRIAKETGFSYAHIKNIVEQEQIK
jgi:hypothetical protein